MQIDMNRYRWKAGGREKESTRNQEYVLQVKCKQQLQQKIENSKTPRVSIE